MTIEADRPVLPEDRYVATAGRVQLTGIQALARLPIEQHRRDLAAGLDVGTLITGYEGSPLAGYDLELGRMKSLLDLNDVVFVPGLNEEAAATAVQGSQLAPTLDGATRDGVVGIWYGKAPGLDRASDAIRHGTLMGSHPSGGAVLLVGDDPAAKSSSVPCASDFALQDLMVPFLHPGDSSEILRYGRHAIALARATGLWTALKIVTAVADGSSTVDLTAEPAAIELPPGAGGHRPTARLLQPALGPLERELVGTRLRLAREYARLNRLNRIVGRGPSDRVGVVASGRTWHDVRSVLDRFGLGEHALDASPVRLLKVAMPYPLDAGTVAEFADGLEVILVVEEKRAFMETAFRELLYGADRAPRIVGKHDLDGGELLPAYGDLDADAITRPMHRVLSAAAVDCGPAPGRPRSPARMMLPLVNRAPYFCSGCPHNSSTKPVEGALVGGGIGCHAMVLLMDEAQVGTVTGLAQMGGEGLQWVGMAPFVDRDHYVQNLGDGTFAHSGSLAIRAAVAAGVNITYKLLFNGAVAMTGGQRAVGGMDVPRIVDLLLAEGVSRVLITTEDRARYRRVRLPRHVEVWDRSRLQEAQRVLAATPGVTVLIHDQECATEKRRRRKRRKDAPAETRVFINERVCEGCGDCGRKSNCLSVQPVPTRYGRKTRIHQASCNTDLSCLDGDCPAFMTVTGGTQRATTPPERLAEGDLPAPPARPGGAEARIRLTGIGGTGVVTVSQVLATAGLLAGFSTRSLDQTGLAQKGGAVVSDVLLGRTRGTTNKIAAGECDLYLGCDLLVAAQPANLEVAAADRTVSVLSTSQVPTGAMVSDPSVAFPDAAALADQVAARSGTTHRFDARALALDLFGDDQYANVLLLGAGFQTGALPVPAAAIERAIELNGVAVETNIQAFRRGRQYVADPETVLALAGRRSKVAAKAPEGLDELVDHFAGELAAYQDAGYAQAYRRRVLAVRDSERQVTPDGEALTDAVARQLFKLMAYKDEYEVARLSLRPELDAELAAIFGAGARVHYRLHPPILRAMGVQRKIALGRWFRPGFRALYAARRLRGTPLDPFGRARVRRVERALIDEYVEVVARLTHDLTVENLALAVEVAELPDMVRGYEDVKLGNVDRYRSRMAELLGRWSPG
ncbi:indolepyruvate ferredoxin oxidoreductase [Sphaerisporangium rufum]|uniref:Indolepyruvate ferredoxin oxidoreductase n=1 Tax=Sphaerisporangium rufum TaxID=1381558 RepID=A0A919V1F7_9ACTN|nr:indolepyruvate ferredoxin oxidoreductase family protein [Sphaerisporangium rufum]GII81056.1 indolepyruvate ferredoxin oxidoreductase [Sphaerisporangium rufum]